MSVAGERIPAASAPSLSVEKAIHRRWGDVLWPFRQDPRPFIDELALDLEAEPLQGD